MPLIRFPYGNSWEEYDFNEENFQGNLSPPIADYQSRRSQQELIQKAIQNPIGTAPLHVLACGKQKITILISDHTRPVPSRLILPILLSEVRKGNPEAEITFLVATGCHRASTCAELEKKLGPILSKRERIVIHNCDASMKYCGILPSGGALWLDPIAAEADLLIAEGFIEPHFFAGFSGGRKSVLPGIAGRSTILYNHNSAFIAHPNARAGVLDKNPVHTDMVYAAQAVNLAFICNGVLNGAGNVVYAVAGDCVRAHERGCAFLYQLCKVPSVQADIVVTSNGGYPLDQNVYQAVKGLSTARDLVKKGGVIVMLAESGDGPVDNFLQSFAENPDLVQFEQTILQTTPDQWQSQILIRVLRHASVIYVSSLAPETIRKFHMLPAASLEEALGLARKQISTDAPKVVALPNGVGAIVERNGFAKNNSM